MAVSEQNLDIISIFLFFFVYAFVCIFSVATNISPVYWGAVPALRWAAASGWGALSGAGGA